MKMEDGNHRHRRKFTLTRILSFPAMIDIPTYSLEQSNKIFDIFFYVRVQMYIQESSQVIRVLSTHHYFKIGDQSVPLSMSLRVC